MTTDRGVTPEQQESTEVLITAVRDIKDKMKEEDTTFYRYGPKSEEYKIVSRESADLSDALEIENSSTVG